MIPLLTLVLFYFSSLFMGFKCNIDPKIIQESRHKYPWMVVIYDLNNCEGLVNYGTIIHKRVILTLANTITEKSGRLKCQVWFDCYISVTFSILDKKKIIPRLMQIREYRSIKCDFHRNLEILILKQPLQLSDHVNVINLYRENDQFDPHNCILLSLFTYSLFTKYPNWINTQTTFIRSYAVILNQTHLNVVTSPNNQLIPLDEQERALDQDKTQFYKTTTFFGGPLYCKSQNTEEWGQLAITDLIMNIEEAGDNSRLAINGTFFRLDKNIIHNAIKEVIESFNISDFN